MLQCIKHTHAQAHMQTHSALFFVFLGGGGVSEHTLGLQT